MKKFLKFVSTSNVLLVFNILVIFITVGFFIYKSNAIGIIKCRTAQVTKFQIDPDYYYHGKEKGMNDAWYTVELSNGASYKVNIQKYDTTYDFQFSEDEFHLFGYHLTGFLYEPQLRRLFKQNFEFYQKLTNCTKIFTYQINETLLEVKKEKEKMAADSIIMSKKPIK